MSKITINRQKCKGCLLCISFCPKGLIKVSRELNKQGVMPVNFSRLSGIPPPAKAGSRKMREKVGKDNNECTGCSLCAIICPDCCITVYK